MTTDTLTRAGKRSRWLWAIAASAAVAIWSGWVSLGQAAGFGMVQPLPGILPWHLDTAITLPVGIEAYGAFALGAWLSPAGVPGRARSWARNSAVGALCLGMAGQVASHLLAAAGMTRAPWPVTVLVSCVPVVTLGFAAALTHLLRGDTTTDTKVDKAADAWQPAMVTMPRSEAQSAGQSNGHGGGQRKSDKLDRLLVSSPDKTNAQLAKLAGVHERTVARHKAAARQDEMAAMASGNGKAHD